MYCHNSLLHWKAFDINVLLLEGLQLVYLDGSSEGAPQHQVWKQNCFPCRSSTPYFSLLTLGVLQSKERGCLSNVDLHLDFQSKFLILENKRLIRLLRLAEGLWSKFIHGGYQLPNSKIWSLKHFDYLGYNLWKKKNGSHLRGSWTESEEFIFCCMRTSNWPT